jgi:hypothetical protein
MRHTEQGLLILLLCSLAAGLQAEVYRWVDEQGRVHFSDRPPRQTEPSYSSQAASGAAKKSGTAAATGNETGRREKELRMLRILEAEREKKAATAARQKRLQSIQRRNCEIARMNLDAARASNRIYRRDADGNKVYFNEAEIAKEMAARQAKVDKWCGQE